MMRAKWLVLVLLSVVGLLSAQISMAQADPIRIGVAIAQTSNVSLLAQDQAIAAGLAATYYNAQGGVNGRPIELVVQDTAGDEAGAIAAFQSLISSDVVGIIGPTLSQQAFAADPLAEAAQVPVVAPSNTAKGIPDIGNFVARVSAPVSQAAPNAVKAALKIDPNIKDVAVFYAQDDAFATSETGTFQETVGDLRLNLATVQTYLKSDTDFTTQITTALSFNPQLVIVSGLAADGGNLVKQLREFGYTGLVVGGNGFNTSNIYPICQAACDGILVAQAYNYTLDSEINNAFREAYKADQGKEPSQIAAQAFTAVQVYVEALRELDKAVGLANLDLAQTRVQLNDYVLMGSYNSPVGQISFLPNGEIIQANFYVAQVHMNADGQSGQFVYLDYSFETPPMVFAVEPIVVGVAIAQTGNVALLGQEQVIGAKLAETYFNAKGGVNGRPIQLDFQDTAGDEAGAIAAFQNLISANVAGIIGPTLSQQAFAADPLAEEAKIPVLAPSNTAKGIPDIGNYIARVSAPVAVVAPNAVKAALEIDPSIKDVAVFYAQDDAFATSETGTFQETVAGLGLNVATVQTFQKTDTDFSAQITNALSLNPQLAIVSGLAADGGNLVKQLREFGFTGLIIGGNGLNTANIFPVCQASCDGIIIAQAYSYSAESEINTAFREAYKAEQGKEPPQFSAQAFAAVQVFVEALTALDNEVGLANLDTAALHDQLNAKLLSLSYDTPLGTISFTETGEIVQGQYYVAQIKMNEDGQTGSFVFIR